MKDLAAGFLQLKLKLFIIGLNLHIDLDLIQISPMRNIFLPIRKFRVQLQILFISLRLGLEPQKVIKKKESLPSQSGRSRTGKY